MGGTSEHSDALQRLHKRYTGINSDLRFHVRFRVGFDGYAPRVPSHTSFTELQTRSFPVPKAEILGTRFSNERFAGLLRYANRSCLKRSPLQPCAAPCPRDLGLGPATGDLLTSRVKRPRNNS